MTGIVVALWCCCDVFVVLLWCRLNCVTVGTCGPPYDGTGSPGQQFRSGQVRSWGNWYNCGPLAITSFLCHSSDAFLWVSLQNITLLTPMRFGRDTTPIKRTMSSHRVKNSQIGSRVTGQRGYISAVCSGLLSQRQPVGETRGYSDEHFRPSLCPSFHMYVTTLPFTRLHFEHSCSVGRGLRLTPLIIKTQIYWI